MRRTTTFPTKIRLCSAPTDAIGMMVSAERLATRSARDSLGAIRGGWKKAKGC